MAWTYTNDPENVQLDAVRLLIGDLDGDDPQLTDEELDYYLAEEVSTIKAAIAAVRGLIALYARRVDKAVGDLRQSYSQRMKSYEVLLRQLQTKRASTHYAPVAGGISQARKDTVKEDTDRVAPAIERDQFSYPGTESSDDELLLDS